MRFCIVIPQPILMWKDEVETMISPIALEKVGDREINNICDEIMEKLDATFYMDKCRNISNVTPEVLSSLSKYNISFIKPGICDDVDTLLSDCFDSRTKLEAICGWFSKQISKIEKPSKLTKNTNYVKIHETSKSDPMLMGTVRRIKFLKDILEKEWKSGLYETKMVTLEYIDFNDEPKTFDFTWDNLEYVTHGSNKKDMVIVNSEIQTLTSNIQTAESKLISEIIIFYKKFVQEFTRYDEYMSYISHYVTEC